MDLSGVQEETQTSKIVILARKILIDNADASLVLRREDAEGRRDGGRLVIATLDGFEGIRQLNINASGSDNNNTELCQSTVPSAAENIRSHCRDGRQHSDVWTINSKPGSGGEVKLFSHDGYFNSVQVNVAGGSGVGCDIVAEACDAKLVSKSRNGKDGTSEETSDLSRLSELLPADELWFWEYNLRQDLE
jgi:hypothetical protein